MKHFLKNIIVLILFPLWGLGGFGLGAYAQLYPVQMTPVFNSPYSVKISDYATSIDAKMQLHINPTDIAISQRQVRLKLYIQGNGLNVQSSEYIQGQRPIYINGGELQTITNTDIAALFRLENLQGISPVQYANALPEGMYNFCFEMYDFVTNQKISQKSCASLYLILNDPPILNTPQRNEQIAATEFPNILFTWTPRQRNATNVSYKFELKQLIDPTLDPQIAFQMSPILYEETLFGTALLYNLSMPILTPGLRYAWRVKAISTAGLSENAVFKNDGYSEIYSFKYTASCAAPTFLLSESQSSKSVKITWEGTPEHTRYQVQYKKQDVRNAQWFSTNSLNTQSLITNLEPGVTYQFRVGSSCDPATDGVQSFTYSGISTFTTPTETSGVPAYNCGIVPQINIQNQKPLTNLIQSETFKAGDFPVTILELQGENSPYSGRGYIIVPYLADTKIAVEFKDIVINTDYQLIGGVVETSYNPEWKNVADLEDFTGEGQGGQIEETVPFAIKDIIINANGDILVNGFDGEQITIPGGKDTVITEDLKDADGNSVPGKVYTVDSKGNGSNEGIAAAPGGKPDPKTTDGVDASGQANAFTAQGASMEFSVNDNSKYAFDVMPKGAPEALQKLYKKVGSVALPYKAVVNGFSDTVLATLKLTDTIVKPENIVFKTQNGALINATRSNNTFELTVKGNLSYAEEQILATVKQGDKWKVIGAFMLVHISTKEVNVAIVPTDKVSEDKLDAIIAETQKTYNKVGIKINFKKEGILDISSVVTGSTITTEKNTITSTYSTEQQNINALYKSESYVLFVTNKTSSTGQDGYMRLNGQFGYVFPSKNEAVGLKTPAHELGHGIFKLEHPFEVYKTAEKSTDLLMDYSAGTVLNHQDWKQINDPAFKFYGFQSQASGELNDITEADLINAIDLKITSYVIAKSRHRKGRNEDNSGPHHDMMSGDMTDEQMLKLNPMFSDEIMSYEDNLLSAYRNLVKTYSMGDLEDVNMRMVDKFVESKGNDEFENKDLTYFAEKHESTQRFIRSVKNNIVFQLHLDPYFATKQKEIAFNDKLGYDTMKDPIKIRKDIPSPSWGNTYIDKIGGLGIAINDTWGYDIKVIKFVLDKIKKVYSADLEIEVFDHYGLDSLDVDPKEEGKEKYAADSGFRSWFYLQHSKKHQLRPFLTIVKFKKQISGKY